MKSNATAREEELRRFPDRYIDFVKSPHGRVLRANREIRDAFRTHFRDRFARCPDLPLQEFRSYLADFPNSGLLKRLVARVWLLNAKSVMHWSRSASTSRQDYMVYPTKCTWSCRTCWRLVWRICSTIGSPREPSLVALPRAWSHCWRKWGMRSTLSLPSLPGPLWPGVVTPDKGLIYELNRTKRWLAFTVFIHLNCVYMLNWIV